MISFSLRCRDEATACLRSVLCDDHSVIGYCPGLTKSRTDEAIIAAVRNHTDQVLPPAGACSGLLSKVTAFREEVSSLVALSRSSHLALGLGVLLAEGLSLTPEELQLSQPEEALHIGEELLSGTRAALRLAAFSSELHHA